MPLETKLEAWPRISNNDAKGLRRFSDYLGQLKEAMSAIGSLDILNDERENRKLLLKLPDRIITKWGRKVYEFF